MQRAAVDTLRSIDAQTAGASSASAGLFAAGSHLTGSAAPAPARMPKPLQQRRQPTTEGCPSLLAYHAHTASTQPAHARPA